jgi:two-component system response regulator HydG
VPEGAGGLKLQKQRILVVDDEANMRHIITLALEKSGYEIDGAADGEEALGKLRTGGFTLMILDLRMPGMHGLEVLRLAREKDPALVVIVITAHGSKSTAIEAIDKGAYDYFTKPFDLDELRVVVKRALDKASLEHQLRSFSDDLKARQSLDSIIGATPEMRKIFDTIRQVAVTDATVLVTGESGTGKELVAGALHYNSNRSDGPLISLNCAAIPEALLESELFGHEKGAFTGAVGRKPGKFELADKGTLFLDEIADMTLTTQSKLLRVLEERVVERLGGTGKIPVDVRIVAATNRNLEERVQEELFRSDLFFRLNVISMHLPPLRSRPDDIILLAGHFIDHYNAKYKKQVRKIPAGVESGLLAYSWPGNVRELENVIQKAVIMSAGDELEIVQLPAESAVGRVAGRFQEPLDDGETLTDRVQKATRSVEESLIRWALDETRWRRDKAADLLGISRQTLYQKMKQFELDEADKPRG